MDIQELTEPTKLKPWLNIWAKSLHGQILDADTATITDLTIDNVDAKVMTLDNTASVPNPAAGKVSFFSTGSLLKSTDPLGASKSYVTGAAPSVAGNLPMYADATGAAITDSGISALASDQLQSAILDATYGIAPAGQRDLWQYTASGTPPTGSGITYEAGPDMLHSFGNVAGAATYSIDGGVTWAACVFDVVSAGTILIGYNGTIWAAIAEGVTDTYTSADGINFTSGPALPVADANGSNMVWYAAGGLFITARNDVVNGVLTSPDGLTWTNQAGNNALTVAVNSSIAVSVTQAAPYMQYSTDGITWHNTPSTTGQCRAVCWSPERAEFLALDYVTGHGYVSTDGINWADRGVIAPAAVNAVMWVATNSYNRYYATFHDADGNYSLWSTVEPTIAFVDTHLDGALAQPLAYSVGYMPVRDSFFIGVNNSPYFAYSTPRVLDLKDLADNIRVRGFPVNVGCYSTYDDTTCNSTAVETDISTTASSIGTLALQATQPLGMQYQLFTDMQASSAAGDTLTIRIKCNGSTAVTQTLTIPALSVNLPALVRTDITVRSATVHICCEALVSAISNVIVDSSFGYTRTNRNVWSITAQWGAALSTLTVGTVYAVARFPNGA